MLFQKEALYSIVGSYLQAIFSCSFLLHKWLLEREPSLSFSGALSTLP
jgi:hypothetical protein